MQDLQLSVGTSELWANGTSSNHPDYVEIPPEQFTKTMFLLMEARYDQFMLRSQVLGW